MSEQEDNKIEENETKVESKDKKKDELIDVIEKKLQRFDNLIIKHKNGQALTEKEQEDEKENEIDELLEFAYELDYEKYMEDFEVR